MILEIWGYLSMIIVLLSMMMDNVRKLRIVNSIACAMFMVYGWFHQTYPVILMNFLVIVINLYQLKKSK
jgi:hypothetical protein